MRKEIAALRTLMEERGIDVYIVPTCDFHGSEYINEYFSTRKFLSGFTGSAGTLVITKDDAKLWTDGRYFLQAGIQLDGSGIKLMKSGDPGVSTIEEYLDGILGSEKTLAFDGRVVSYETGEAYGKIAVNHNSNMVYDIDLAGEIWKSRPSLQGKPVYALPVSSTGKSTGQKLAEIREIMSECGADRLLITSLEENAWLYNLRGNDVKCTPVFFAFSLITQNDIMLYVFDDAVSADLLPEYVTVRNYYAVMHDIAELPEGSSISADLKSVSYGLIKSIPDGCRIINRPSPAAELKAVKNETEIESTKKAHLGDGVAMVEFISWLKRNIGKMHITEISASDYLESLRRVQDGFIELSFDTIAGYMQNGAVIHYTATEETDRELAPEGLFLVDSGGHYTTGTTDITRTISLGALTDKMRECYTAVLRGHIDLLLASFAPGTTGHELDRIAREPIREIGLDYNHGTGHGVGHVLSVHEGPNNIGKRPVTAPITPGMITTDEPGVYLAGEFGIRIESEMLCTDNGNGRYSFDNLTLCPYERDAIIKEKLTDKQLEYVNTYHKRVYDALCNRLSPEAAQWLSEATMPL